jgi:hypothetical protein
MPPDFEQLIRQHGARIRRIARRYAAAAAVDDLVQDIPCPPLEPTERSPAWLETI